MPDESLFLVSVPAMAVPVVVVSETEIAGTMLL